MHSLDCYTVVYEKHIDNLIGQVNSLQKDGWVCQGGLVLTVDPYNNQRHFYQAMTRETP